MSDGAARAILQHLGLAAGVSTAIPSYDRTDGSTATLAARPTVLDSDGAPDWSRDPVVVSLARWDRIKDPLGILDGSGWARARGDDYRGEQHERH